MNRNPADGSTVGTFGPPPCLCHGGDSTEGRGQALDSDVGPPGAVPSVQYCPLFSFHFAEVQQLAEDHHTDMENSGLQSMYLIIMGFKIRNLDLIISLVSLSSQGA